MFAWEDQARLGMDQFCLRDSRVDELDEAERMQAEMAWRSKEGEMVERRVKKMEIG